MQNIKDSFYIAVRNRLAAVNPLRVVSFQGVSRPGIMVSENEIATDAQPLGDVYYIAFGEVVRANKSDRTGTELIKMSCEISYRTQGTEGLNGHDRGRKLASLDEDLLSITQPMQAEMVDFSQTPALDTGTKIFWSRPTLDKVTQAGSMLARIATLELYAILEAA